LTFVLGDVGVNKVDDVRADGSMKDGRDFDCAVGISALKGEDFSLGSIAKRLDTLNK
jgi:hypothetical protein